MPNSYLIMIITFIKKFPYMVAKEEVAQLIIIKFPEILISILVTIALIQPKLYLPVHIYVHHIRMYIISIFFIFIDNVMSLCTRFYNAVLDQQVVLTDDIQLIFFYQRRTYISILFLIKKILITNKFF